MCIGNIFGSKPAMPYLPPPPKPDPALDAKLDSQRKTGLVEQEEATRARKQQLSAGMGRRSLLSSSGGGYLSNTTNTRLG